MVVTKFEMLRREAGLSKVQLAEKSGVTRQTISRIEKGNIGTVNVETLIKCADAIGCAIVDFFL